MPTIPAVTERPGITAGYGVQPDPAGLLPWSWARERLQAAPNYWVATTNADGSPHVAPVWGAWVDGAVWFGTDPGSVKGHNLRRDPRVVVHLESGDEAVIARGVATSHRGADLEPERARRIDEAFAAKYRDGETGEPFRLIDGAPEARLWRLAPDTVLGWLESAFATTPTRWRFDA